MITFVIASFKETSSFFFFPKNRSIITGSSNCTGSSSRFGCQETPFVCKRSSFYLMVALVNKTEEHQLPEGYNLRKLELSDYFNGKVIM